MELETHVQVSTNQLRRQDEEKKVLKEDIERAQQRDRELLTKLKESDRKNCDLESKVSILPISKPVNVFHTINILLNDLP